MIANKLDVSNSSGHGIVVRHGNITEVKSCNVSQCQGVCVLPCGGIRMPGFGVNIQDCTLHRTRDVVSYCMIADGLRTRRGWL